MTWNRPGPDLSNLAYVDAYLKHVAFWLALRARDKALAIGDMRELPTDRRKPVFAALRTSEDGTERAVTVFNFSAQPCRVSVQPGDGIDRLRNYLSGEVTQVEDGTVLLDLGRFG